MLIKMLPIKKLKPMIWKISFMLTIISFGISIATVSKADPFQECDHLINLCSKVVEEKNKVIELKDLQIEKRDEYISSLETQVSEAQSQLNSPFRNPFIAVPVGIVLGVILMGVISK